MAAATYHVNHDRAAVILGSDLAEMNRISLKLRKSRAILSGTGWASVWRTIGDDNHVAVIVPYAENSIEVASEIADEIVYRLEKTPDLMPEYDLIFRRHLKQ